MEIDLELPSGELERLDTGPNTIANEDEGIVGFHTAEEDVDSPTSPNSMEACEHARIQGVIGGVDVDGACENAAGADGDKAVICEPKIGLRFETKEAAYSFYREYARFVGFGITIKASRRSKKSGKFIDVKIACSRFGNKRESNTTSNPRPCIKTDCKAGMHMKRTEDDKWIIHSFVKDHNHEICPNDFYNATLRGRGKQSDIVACQKKGLQLALDEEDVQFMLEHFISMQAKNPNFFYAIDLDHEKRMRNVFWVDAKGRHDYSIFCDVVFLDTFYVGSRYRIPYASVVGVNHHYQFILLGCSLIGEQSTSTFVWLMQTWLKAMGGQAPKVIITDQDKFLSEAVADVFPDTRHCHCLWHILNMIPEKLCSVMEQSEGFMAKFYKCIYKSWTDEQFEKRWGKMVDRFELKEDQWVQALFENRKRWAPTYMRDVFLAGISTSERSGSIASFFDKYFHREATFKEFMEQYKIFLQDRYEMEAKADFETQNKQLSLRSLSAFEKQMSMTYTDAIFKKFQVEVLGAVSCHLQKESEDGTTIHFRVDDFEDRQNFLVAWNREALEICCSCRSFEYRGFLCKHAILVLQMSGAFDIPSRYILKRWTKDAKISQVVSDAPSNLNHRTQRFNDLCKRAIKLGEEGSLSLKAYDIALQALEEALENCVGVNNSGRTNLEHGFLCIQEEIRKGMGKSLKKKKKHKRKKVFSEPEEASFGLQENCQQMEQMNPRAHTTGDCYVPQQDMQEMELGSRAPTLDGYYVPQQSMQGVEQLNSVPPIRDGYYDTQQGLLGLGHFHSIPTRDTHHTTQQSMHELGHLGFRAPTVQGCFDIQGSLQDLEQPVSSSQLHGNDSKHLQD